MKKITLIFAGIVIAVVGVIAQSPQYREPKSPEERAQQFSEKMRADLSLSDTQTASVYDIHLKYAKERDQVRLEKANEIEESRKQMMQSGKKEEAEILLLLTQEQITTWEQIKKEQKVKRQKRRKI